MRIAFVSLMTAAPWGASEALWAQSAQRALDQGHTVFVSVSGWPTVAPELQALRERGALVRPRTRNRWVRRSALLARAAGTFIELRRFRPDVICVNQGGTYDIARSGSVAELRRLLRSMRVPSVLLCHCEQAPPPRRRISSARRIFEHSAAVGFTARRAQAVTEHHLGIALTNGRVFQNPVNLQRVEYLRWPNENGLRFAYVGRLEAVKNLHALIEAFAKPPWVDRAWSLSLFGSGSQRESLEHLVATKGLVDKVRFAGYVSDVASIWADHHTLLLPSHLEGVPLAMIEAMLCGRPVVATDTGGIAEWVEDGRNGFLISEPNVGHISNALERVWTDRDRLRQMGEYAHTSTCSKRDPDPAGTLLRWLCEIALRPPSSPRSDTLRD